MNYTTEQVIDLHEQYLQLAKDTLDNMKFGDNYDIVSFSKWLKDKEQSLPFKGQTIWVKEGLFDDSWLEVEFVEFNKIDQAVCLSQNKKIKIAWDEYSLTKPD